jgi:K+ transporter
MNMLDKVVLGGYVVLTVGTFFTLVAMVWSDSRKKQK